MITAVNSVSYKSYYNNLNFGDNRKQKMSNEPRHSSSALKAIPLATLIAMSPLNASSANYGFEQNPEKIIAMQKFQDESKSMTVRFVDTDGDETTVEKINLETIQAQQGNAIDRQTNKRVPVKYMTVDEINIDSLKQVNVTNQFGTGRQVNTTEYYAIGDATFYVAPQKATDGSNKVIRQERTTKSENHSYEIPEQIYNFLIEVTGDGIPRKAESETRVRLSKEDMESLGL